MSKAVGLSKDGNSIHFTEFDSVPTTVKKLRHSPEIKSFYKFILEHNLQKESYEILTQISQNKKVPPAQK